MNVKEHLLTVLIEECSEVQKEACKGLRFGTDDHDPQAPELSNQERLEKEIVQLYAVIDMLDAAGIIDLCGKDLEVDTERKKDRVREYMKYARTRGTLV